MWCRMGDKYRVDPHPVVTSSEGDEGEAPKPKMVSAQDLKNFAHMIQMHFIVFRMSKDQFSTLKSELSTVDSRPYLLWKAIKKAVAHKRKNLLAQYMRENPQAIKATNLDLDNFFKMRDEETGGKFEFKIPEKAYDVMSEETATLLKQKIQYDQHGSDIWSTVHQFVTKNENFVKTMFSSFSNRRTSGRRSAQARDSKDKAKEDGVAQGQDGASAKGASPRRPKDGPKAGGRQQSNPRPSRRTPRPAGPAQQS